MHHLLRVECSKVDCLYLFHCGIVILQIALFQIRQNFGGGADWKSTSSAAEYATAIKTRLWSVLCWSACYFVLQSLKSFAFTFCQLSVPAYSTFCTKTIMRSS